MSTLKESDSTLITDKSGIAETFRGMFEKILFKPRQKKFIK